MVNYQEFNTPPHPLTPLTPLTPLWDNKSVSVRQTSKWQPPLLAEIIVYVQHAFKVKRISFILSFLFVFLIYSVLLV